MELETLAVRVANAFRESADPVPFRRGDSERDWSVVRGNLADAVSNFVWGYCAALEELVEGDPVGDAYPGDEQPHATLIEDVTRIMGL